MTRRFSNQRTAAGISLVEMMIAMVIGLVLMLGVIQVFSASRTASMLAEGSARAQENGRFAMDFLQRDIRMAGHFGCVNDQAHFVRGEGDPAINTVAVSGSGHPLDFSISVQGYEAPNTKPPGTLTLGDTWAVPVNLPAAITKLNPRGGSDILVLRYLAPEGVPIKALTTGSDSVVGFDATAGLRLTEGGKRHRTCSELRTAIMPRCSKAPMPAARSLPPGPICPITPHAQAARPCSTAPSRWCITSAHLRLQASRH